MANEEDIRRYTIEEIRAMRARGESRTDMARVLAKTEQDLARDTASDPAWDGIPEDWYLNAVPVYPEPKKLLSLRLDSDIIAWFRQQGPGYQTRMNAVLRAYMRHAGRASPTKERVRE